ncbi:putative protein phosphatase 2C 48 [Zea mays]|uniref:Uncharacterized protein n=1 Tax=Zea mays TaxID=4577 RepID=A0A3L6ECK9_MAIZE|nr:putative protein phosphatase 2C 48 [Zea mays]
MRFEPTTSQANMLVATTTPHEALALASLIDDEKKLGDCQFDLWKQYYVTACVIVFGKLRRSRHLDAVEKGLHRAVHLKQGDLMVVTNVGDSWVVLGTTSDNGAVTPSSSSSLEAQPATFNTSYLVLQAMTMWGGNDRRMKFVGDAKILRRNFMIDLISYEDNSCRYVIPANIQQRLIDIAKKD